MSFLCFGCKDIPTIKSIIPTGNIALDLFTDLKSLATSEETKIHPNSWKEDIEISNTAKFLAEIL